MKVILVVTYLAFNAPMATVEQYQMPSFDVCQHKAAQIFKQVKAGKVSTVCWRV